MWLNRKSIPDKCWFCQADGVNVFGQLMEAFFPCYSELQNETSPSCWLTVLQLQKKKCRCSIWWFFYERETMQVICVLKIFAVIREPEEWRVENWIKTSVWRAVCQQQEEAALNRGITHPVAGDKINPGLPSSVSPGSTPSLFIIQCGKTRSWVCGSSRSLLLRISRQGCKIVVVFLSFLLFIQLGLVPIAFVLENCTPALSCKVCNTQSPILCQMTFSLCVNPSKMNFFCFRCKYKPPRRSNSLILTLWWQMFTQISPFHKLWSKSTLLLQHWSLYSWKALSQTASYG